MSIDKENFTSGAVNADRGVAGFVYVDAVELEEVKRPRWRSTQIYSVS